MSLHFIEASTVLIYQQIERRIKMQLLSSFESFISLSVLFFTLHDKMQESVAWNTGKQMKKKVYPD